MLQIPEFQKFEDPSQVMNEEVQVRMETLVAGNLEKGDKETWRRNEGAAAHEM